MEKLEKAREDINAIDKQMAELFSERMNAVKDVAEYKREHALPVFDEEREKAVIEKNIKNITDPDIRSYYISFLKAMMDIAKQYQHRLISGLKVAYSGIEGAFANIAAKRIFPDGQMISFVDFSDAYNAVNNGECDCCVLPIENSYAGEVGQVIDLMFSGALYVNGIYTLQISQNLLGLQEASINDITEVISHPQALSQCAKYIKQRGFKSTSTTNTAKAAQQVAQIEDIHLAAIASEETAQLYGLKIIDHDINESALNSTRFAVFSRVENRETKGKDINKFILLFTVNDVAGALASAINVIAHHGFNMRVLRSRPVKDTAWQYYFYVEAQGDETSEAGREMLSELSSHCNMLKVVGHYSMEINLNGGDLL